MTGPPAAADGRTQSGDGDAQLSPMALLTRAMVGVYMEQFGRGPVQAFSHWAGPDTIV